MSINNIIINTTNITGIYRRIITLRLSDKIAKNFNEYCERYGI
jgi:hypothetical protein